MYKIQADVLQNKKYMYSIPNAKKVVIQKLLSEISYEIFKQKCFGIEEGSIIHPSSIYHIPDQVKIKVELLVMTHTELKKVMVLLELITKYLPDHAKTLAEELFSIITKMPIQD